MSALITMLEEADCGSGWIDANFAVALRIGTPKTPEWAFKNFPVWRAREDGRVEVVHDDGRGGLHWKPQPFSTSLDAALSALPEGWEYSITTVYGFATVELPLNCGDHVPSVRVIRADCNAALALITAILKATREG